MRHLFGRWPGNRRPAWNSLGFDVRRVQALLLPALLMALALGALMPQGAAAKVRICRADPIVWLSNGERLKLTVGISARASDVAAITYTVHAPAGTKVKKIVYNGNPNLRSKETVVFVADLAANHYTVDTLVTMQDPSAEPVAVIARSMLRNQKVSASGQSGEPIPFSFTLSR